MERASLNSTTRTKALAMDRVAHALPRLTDADLAALAAGADAQPPGPRPGAVAGLTRLGPRLCPGGTRRGRGWPPPSRGRRASPGAGFAGLCVGVPG